MNTQLKAQQGPQEPGSLMYDLVWNPAGTADHNHLSFGVNNRQEWFGFKNAPRTGILYVEKSFWEQNMSVGGYIQKDQNGFFSDIKIGLNYSYQLRINEVQLSVGIGFWTNSISFDLSNLRTLKSDPVVENLNNGRGYEGNVGIYLSNKVENFEDESNFFFGAYLDKISTLFKKSDLINNVYDNVWQGGIYGGIQLKYKNIDLEPMFWIDYENHSPLRYYGGASVNFYETLLFGLYYSNDERIHTKIEVSIHNRILRDGCLRVYAIPSLNLGNGVLKKTISIEVGIRYDFIQELIRI